MRFEMRFEPGVPRKSAESLTFALLAMRDREDATPVLSALRCPVLFVPASTTESLRRAPTVDG